MQIQADQLKVSQILDDHTIDKKQVALRQANFLSLCNLQNQLPKAIFEQVTQNFNQPQHLPSRVAFDSSFKKCDFEELKVITGHQNSSSLQTLLKSQEEFSRKIQKFSDFKNSKKFRRNPVKTELRKSKFHHFIQKSSSLPYISNFKNRNALVKQISKNQLIKSKDNLIRETIENHDSDKYKRMKTVFGHANILEGAAIAVYNVKFDLEDKFIITGADDGIIKVWSKDTLILQASLHGHKDVIIDIAISKCNRFMASGSKDGTLIIWDLKQCKIIKKLDNDHSQQVNGIQFIMVECTKKQGLKNVASLQGGLQGATRTQEKSQQLQQYQAMTSNFSSGHNQLSNGLPPQSQAGRATNSEVNAPQSSQNISSQGIMSGAQQFETQYDQFLVSCSDDGSINIYDVSSFTSQGNDEFYTRGLTNSDRIFTPHSKILVTQKQSKLAADRNQIIYGLKDLQKSKLEEEQKDPSDKISRRTRKRQLVTNLTQTNTNQTTANSSSQSQNNQNSQERDIYMVKLRPEDFRQGSRNKHIDACSVSARGLLAGGTNHGEAFLWQVNFNNIRARKADGHFQWIGSFKLHKKANHYMRFSPSGDMLMTGSADGTSSIWDTKFLEKRGNRRLSSEELDIIQVNSMSRLSIKDIELGQEQLIYRFEEPGAADNCANIECLIDGIEWSVNGRYAFCAISVKQLPAQRAEGEEGPPPVEKPAVVKVKVYDTLSGSIIQNLDLACGLGSEMVNYSSVLKAHPKNEDILLSCFDGGITILYDVRSLKIVQQIIEHGIYSIEQFAMNNAVDVDFSSDGEYMAFTSIFGTLSLYTTESHRQALYAGTRVQQFFAYDNQRHDHNLYQSLTCQPQLCGFELNPYEVQPTGPQIGPFQLAPPLTKQEIEQAFEEFERQQMFAREFAKEEETFYQDQLKDGLRQGLFHHSSSTGPGQEGVRNSPARAEPLARLISSGQGQPIVQNDAQMHEDSDLEILQPSLRPTHIRQRGRRALIRTDEQPEDVEDSNDIDMEDDDEDFDDGHSGDDDQRSDDENDSLDSERRIAIAYADANNRKQIPILDREQRSSRRENYHEFGMNQDQYLEDREENRSLANSQQRRSLRPQRGNHEESKLSRTRQNTGNAALQMNSQSQESLRQGHQRPRRLRQVVPSGETSLCEDAHDDESNFGESPPARNARRTRRGNLAAINDLSASQEPSCEEYDSEEDDQNDRKARRLPARQSRNRNSNAEEQGRLRRSSRQREPEDDDELLTDEEKIRRSRRPTRRAAALTERLQQVEETSEMSASPANQRSRANHRSRDAPGRSQRAHGNQEASRRTGRTARGLRARRNSGNADEDLDSSIQILDNGRATAEDRGATKSWLNGSPSAQEKSARGSDASAAFDERFEKLITEIPTRANPDLERDEAFSQRGSKSKKGAVIARGARMPLAETLKGADQFDEGYSLSCNASVTAEKICYFCKRNMDRHQLVGPFLKDKAAHQQILESQDSSGLPDEIPQGLYFHQKCLEANNIVRYDKTRQKWLNISTAIAQLLEQKTYTCYRCLLKGATVSCGGCDRAFHGHLCKDQYLLATDETNLAFSCLFCRNTENHRICKDDTEKTLQRFRAKEIDGIRKSIPKLHLLETKPCSIDNFYAPQLGDEVMYFFQGHENFVQSNNCYFYCGNQKAVSSTDLPWMRIPQLKKKPNGSVHCVVINVTHRFAPLYASLLIEKFGECSSDIIQRQQIISYVELEIVDTQLSNLKVNRFLAPIFPCEASQYLVPIQLFNHKLALFEKNQAEGRLIGGRFKTLRASSFFSGHDVRVCDIGPLEPEICPEGLWEALVVTEIDNSSMMRADRGRRGAQGTEATFDPFLADRINFWDLIYPEEVSCQMPELLTSLLPKAFDEMESARLVDALGLLIQKKFDTCCLFLDRVPETLAHDYKSYVSAEMWLNLILERLRSSYYRSQEQLWFDLDLITYCSKTYNGPEDDVTCSAEAMVDKIRKDLRVYININKESRLQGNTKPKNLNSQEATALGFGVNDDESVSVTVQPKQEASNALGYANNTIELTIDSVDVIKPRKAAKARFGRSSIGQGGLSVKDHLKSSLEQEGGGVAVDGKIVLEFEENIAQGDGFLDQSAQGVSQGVLANVSSQDQRLSREDWFVQPPSRKRGRPRKQKVIQDEGVGRDNGCFVQLPVDISLARGSEMSDTIQNFDQVISQASHSAMPQISENGEFTVQFVQGIITIDKQGARAAKNGLPQRAQQRQSRGAEFAGAANLTNREGELSGKLGIKRKRETEEDSEVCSSHAEPENGSNVENSMSHNVDSLRSRTLTRGSKRQRIEL